MKIKEKRNRKRKRIITSQQNTAHRLEEASGAHTSESICSAAMMARFHYRIDSLLTLTHTFWTEKRIKIAKLGSRTNRGGKHTSNTAFAKRSQKEAMAPMGTAIVARSKCIEVDARHSSTSNGKETKAISHRYIARGSAKPPPPPPAGRVDPAGAPQSVPGGPLYLSLLEDNKTLVAQEIIAKSLEAKTNNQYTTQELLQSRRMIDYNNTMQNTIYFVSTTELPYITVSGAAGPSRRIAPQRNRTSPPATGSTMRNSKARGIRSMEAKERRAQRRSERRHIPRQNTRDKKKNLHSQGNRSQTEQTHISSPEQQKPSYIKCAGRHGAGNRQPVQDNI